MRSLLVFVLGFCLIQNVYALTAPSALKEKSFKKEWGKEEYRLVIEKQSVASLEDTFEHLWGYKPTNFSFSTSDLLPTFINLDVYRIWLEKMIKDRWKETAKPKGAEAVDD